MIKEGISPHLKLSENGVAEGMPVELESLAAAGYYFVENSTDEIRFVKTDGKTFYDRPCFYGDGPFILSPNEGDVLLLRRDFFHAIPTVDIAQTEIPGVIEIVTQPRKHISHRFYQIHMSPNTITENLEWSTISLKEYNRLRYEHYRTNLI